MKPLLQTQITSPDCYRKSEVPGKNKNDLKRHKLNKIKTKQSIDIIENWNINYLNTCKGTKIQNENR